eukprot:5518230-Pyramimonas_sp.AAC.1
MRSYAQIAERTPGNLGGRFSHGRRTETFHTDTHVGQPATNVGNDDPQPTEATTLLAQHGGQPTGSQDSGARYRDRRQRRPLPKPLPL